MKHWAVLVVLLYGAALVALTVPATYLAFAEAPPKGPTVAGLAQAYLTWQYWLFVIAIPLCAQALLLAVPVRRAQGRPVRRRSVWATAVAAGFAIGLLAMGLLFTLLEAADLNTNGGSGPFWTILGVAVASWVFWAFLFAREARIRPPDDWMGRICRWLYAGSIAELLVAVPSHIIARRRDQCCAGFWTFFGISCGLAVLLLAFGPAVFSLFAKRWRQLHPTAAASGPPS